MVVARRSYEQFCGLAHALDVVGERWTLLIVRELMSGPKRYSDLASLLPGIGTSLLAARAKQLESDGVIYRRLVDPSASTVVYDLTDTGRELARAVAPLAMWGARHFMTDGRDANEDYRAEWSLAFAVDNPVAAESNSADGVVEFRIDDSITYARVVDEHRLEITAAAQSPIQATVQCDAATAVDIAGGRISVADAVEAGLVRAEGPAELLLTVVRSLDHRAGAILEQLMPDNPSLGRPVRAHLRVQSGPEDPSRRTTLPGRR